MVDQVANMSSKITGNNQTNVQSKEQSNINGKAFEQATKSTSADTTKPEATKAPSTSKANTELSNNTNIAGKQEINLKTVNNESGKTNSRTITQNNENGKVSGSDTSSSSPTKAPEAQAKAANESLSKTSELVAKLTASIMEKVNADLKSRGINR